MSINIFITYSYDDYTIIFIVYGNIMLLTLYLFNCMFILYD